MQAPALKGSNERTNSQRC